MNQLDLFTTSKPSGGKKLARNSDPGTSHEAAAGIADEISRLQQVFLDGLKELAEIDGAAIVSVAGKLVKLFGGEHSYTANEVANYVVSHQRGNHLNVETIRKRAGELKQKNDKSKLLVIGEKTCTITGKKATSFSLRSTSNGEPPTRYFDCNLKVKAK